MKNSIKPLFLSTVLLVAFSCNQQIMIEEKDENGVILERYQISKDSLKHGEYLAYYASGSIKESCTYVKGKLQGDRKIFYENGETEIHETYDMDVINGPYKVYHDNGSLKLVVNYYDGVMEGPLKVYYADGILKEEITMKDNNENGPFKEFHPNGNIKWEGQYLNGDNEFGELKEYSQEGVLIRIMLCDSMAVCKTSWKLSDAN